ncbi:alkaline phosphatase D family protein [Pelagicoccus sp. SDUM812005]|uniref:alkaline phosphatase D family protein n=1 Tax=Pelagicoccus sp. SDUM812005 TaxID=3041257 RepID=UPI002810079B|nr:alkaline phosphatase D family protein [Pelagicoccus sp. SDUM812005]MDQ8181233.1 alkaline phosphatase D family protein [Pelagicoccus sp. SDUM812005]
MRSPVSIVCSVALAVLAACTQGLDLGGQRLERVAFGSCLHQDKPAPIWEAIVAAEPDAWVWLGDNIYGDTDDGAVLAAAYAKVKVQPGYARLRESARVFGTWDDHDFGKNNGGKEWHGKAVAQEALLDFLEEPVDSPRREREGVYAAYDFGSGAERVKLLLIDVRTHRDDPKQAGGDLFGKAQRAWIEEELADNEAALTIVASGTQVIPEDHRYEKWAQFPESRQWFFERLVESGTGAVLFVSGDRHISEFSQLELPGREAPVYEMTTSSLTHSWSDFSGEVNRHRVGEVFAQNNFGLLEIDWSARVARVTIRDEAGAVQRALAIEL